MPSQEETPFSNTIGAMKHEEFVKLRNSLFAVAPGAPLSNSPMAPFNSPSMI